MYAIEEAPIYKRYEPLSENAVILHYDGTVVSANDKRLLGRPLQNEQLREAVLSSRKASGSTVYKQDGVSMMASFKKVANNDMFLVVPFDYYSQIEKSELLSFLRSTLAISLSGVIIAAIFAAWLTKSLSSSILALKQGVQQVYEGDMSVRFGEVNIPEISYLGSKINGMLDQISESFEIRKKDEMAKRDLELHLMQSQINPHLLYNTLDGALWALEDERGEQARQILSALSDFYRKTLSGGSMLVPLSSELEMVDRYISIQRLARDMDITFETDVPEELLSFPVIKMTLQPIVENSILHGLSAYRDDGRITISARAGEGRLQLRLADNGLGMLPEELEEIRRDMDTYPPSRALGHFGLYNIHQRIRNHFGEPYGISVESELSAYTRVTIEMPCPEIPQGKTEANGSYV